MSRDDIPAALGIFQTTNPAATVIGALLSALPLAAVAVLVIIGYRAAKEASSEGYALALAAALVCFFVTPWPILIASLVAAPAAGYAMRQRQRQRLMRAPGRRWRKQGTLLILLPCLAVFLYIACVTTWRVLYDVWLPHEATTLQSGRVEVGYVLSDNNNWVAILRSGQRRIVLYRDSQVEKRIPCQLRPHGLLANMTAWQALAPRAWTASSEPGLPAWFQRQSVIACRLRLRGPQAGPYGGGPHAEFQPSSGMTLVPTWRVGKRMGAHRIREPRERDHCGNRVSE